jgi:hypothetical protein
MTHQGAPGQAPAAGAPAIPGVPAGGLGAILTQLGGAAGGSARVQPVARAKGRPAERPVEARRAGTLLQDCSSSSRRIPTASV